MSADCPLTGRRPAASISSALLLAITAANLRSPSKRVRSVGMLAGLEDRGGEISGTGASGGVRDEACVSGDPFLLRSLKRNPADTGLCFPTGHRRWSFSKPWRFLKYGLRATLRLSLLPLLGATRMGGYRRVGA